MQTPRNEFACKFEETLQMGQKVIIRFLVGIWVIVCVQKPSRHFLQTFHPLRMFKIVFRVSPLCPKQCLYFICYG